MLEYSRTRKTALFLMLHKLKKFKTLHPHRFNEWSKNVVNVENHNYLMVNCKILLVIWVQWKRSVCSIILVYSSAFYSLYHFFVLEIFKFKCNKCFIRHSASISKFKWFEQLWVVHLKSWQLHIFKGTLPGLRQYLATESPLKIIKNAFYVTLKALFGLKIFKFLLWLFGHV